MSLETRTNAYQVRTGEFPEEQLSVYVTARQYGSLSPERTFGETLERLHNQAYLESIYMILASLSCFRTLVDKKNDQVGDA